MPQLGTITQIPSSLVWVRIVRSYDLIDSSFLHSWFSTFEWLDETILANPSSDRTPPPDYWYLRYEPSKIMAVATRALHFWDLQSNLRTQVSLAARDTNVDTWLRVYPIQCAGRSQRAGTVLLKGLAVHQQCLHWWWHRLIRWSNSEVPKQTKSTSNWSPPWPRCTQSM